jgi:ribosomal protein S18 acetylase RimI-like enzyme
MELRAITPADYEAVRQFLVEVGWRQRVGSSERFCIMMQNSDLTAVAWDASRVVGFARALCDGVSNGYISMVAVAAERRGEGIGRKLVDFLMGDDPGITWVLRAGRGSEEFWSRVGFKRSQVAMERVRSQR